MTDHNSPLPKLPVPSNSDNSLFRTITVFALVVGISVSFAVGYYYGTKSSVPVELSQQEQKQGELLAKDKPVPAYLSKDVDFSLLWDVWKRVKKDYIVKDAADTKLFYGALAGVVSSLGDPYSVFFDPETSKKFDESLAGSFEGIGAEIGMKKNQLVIVAPLPGSPAEKAGLRSGDMIASINKKDTTGMAVDVAVNLIRGKKGTTVALTLYREGEKKVRDVVITRDMIKIASVTSKFRDDGIAVIKISHFNQDTEGAFKDAVTQVLSKRSNGIILDMRNNPGGYLDTAVQIAGYWVDGKTVVIEQYNDKKQDTYNARVRAAFSDIPTVVLVNEGSASASEIVAGALQDYDKATLVGKKTFGKGSVQDLQHLKDGSSIKLTIAKWLTPKGRSINEEGIKPDIEVTMSDSDYEKNKDPQFDKALEILRNK